MESRYSRNRRRAAIGRARGRREGPLLRIGLPYVDAAGLAPGARPAGTAPGEADRKTLYLRVPDPVLDIAADPSHPDASALADPDGPEGGAR